MVTLYQKYAAGPLLRTNTGGTTALASSVDCCCAPPATFDCYTLEHITNAPTDPPTYDVSTPITITSPTGLGAASGTLVIGTVNSSDWPAVFGCEGTFPTFPPRDIDCCDAIAGTYDLAPNNETFCSWHYTGPNWCQCDEDTLNHTFSSVDAVLVKDFAGDIRWVIVIEYGNSENFATADKVKGTQYLIYQSEPLALSGGVYESRWDVLHNPFTMTKVYDVTEPGEITPAASELCEFPSTLLWTPPQP